MASKEHLRIIISGGGTGGHIFPAIAIADAIKAIRPDTDVLFVGAQGKMEMEKVPAAGYPIQGLPIEGFQRKLTLKNLMFPIKLLRSLLRANHILKSFKPHAVVGVGGFASGPLVQMAVRKGIPGFIQEQNSYPGATNKILAKQVNKIYTAYPEMDKFFPVEKVAYLGNPIRSVIAQSSLTKSEGAAHFGLSPDRPIVLVFGGSLGAGVLNKKIDEALDYFGTQSAIQLIWQTGKFYEMQYQHSKVAQLSNVRKLTFLNQMEFAYAAADLVICRAGALTISELAILGKAAILVPSPNVAADHQTKNAQALSNKHAAIHMPEADLSGLWHRVDDLLSHPQKIEALGSNIRAFAKRDAATLIAQDILDSIS